MGMHQVGQAFHLQTCVDVYHIHVTSYVQYPPPTHFPLLTYMCVFHFHNHTHIHVNKSTHVQVFHASKLPLFTTHHINDGVTGEC